MREFVGQHGLEFEGVPEAPVLRQDNDRISPTYREWNRTTDDSRTSGTGYSNRYSNSFVTRRPDDATFLARHTAKAIRERNNMTSAAYNPIQNDGHCGGAETLRAVAGRVEKEEGGISRFVAVG
jgi:hypothetical protein